MFVQISLSYSFNKCDILTDGSTRGIVLNVQTGSLLRNNEQLWAKQHAVHQWLAFVLCDPLVLQAAIRPSLQKEEQQRQTHKHDRVPMHL